MLRAAVSLALLMMTVLPTRAASVMLEEMTSPELRARIAAGALTVLVPIGGTEQTGPHIVLGKHNVRARVLAERIAQALGNAVVAPVIAYVPEGSIAPPTQHMRYAGTISVPQAAFDGILEGAARSFRQHGFRDVIFLGDHGGYQAEVRRVAARLDKQFGPHVHVFLLDEYYRVAQAQYAAMLKARGFAAAEIGHHGGLADTALALAVDPALVRMNAIPTPQAGARDGVDGDARRASVELGRLGTERIVELSVAAIKARIKDGHS